MWLKKERGICFEDVLEAIDSRRILTVVNNPNQKKYPNQKVLIVEINQYAYAVPYIRKEDEIFLKTIYPSRKFTKHFL